MTEITQEIREQNIERRCIELARCPRNDKVVFGKQMKGYGMRMPEGLGFCDALDWISEYINKVYGPDAIDVTVRVRALERSDVGYRPMLIESEDGKQIEKAELGMNDTFLPDGSPASRCLFHIHLRMNTLMAEDFEALGDNLAGSAAQNDGEGYDDDDSDEDDDTDGESGQHQEGTDLRNSHVPEHLEIDLTTKEGPVLSEIGDIRHGETVEFTVRCPNHDIAFDLLQIIDGRYFSDEGQDSPEASS